jgi:serine phosphatase RsbU (regulator of sigma subunit)/anti-sigma regulatory factor (Ser/Thr protein kinase)
MSLIDDIKSLVANRQLGKFNFVYPAKILYMEDVKKKFTEICTQFNFAYKDLNNILVVVDEACANIIKHAYSEFEGDMEFEVIVRERGIYITVIDHGKSFRWKSFRTPNLNAYVNIGKKGGLGLWIIRKLTDKSDYRVTARGNELILVKYHTRTTLFQQIFRFFSAKGVKEKFVVGAALFILLLMGGVYGYFIRHERDTLREKFISYNVDTVKSIADSSVEMLVRGNNLGLIKLLQETGANSANIKEIFIMDPQGKIIAHNDTARLYTMYKPEGKLRSTTSVKGVMIVRYDTQKSYYYSLTDVIEFRGNELGEVRILITKKAIDNVMSGKRFNMFVVSIIVLLIAMLGVYFLLTVIVRPLEALRQGVMAIGDGRLEHRIEIDGEDEFSQIANAFNDMAKKFKGAQESMLEQEKMQKEIQVAKEIQTTLLPKNIPTAEGFDIASLYRSAKDVGGDYYDIIEVGNNLIGVIVADVSGKGVPGSLVMTITRTALRLLAIGSKSAKSVMVKVNDFVKEDMKKGMFVTAFYLVLDSLTRKITFASAGHDPLILYRAKEDRTYYIKPKGFPLGINLPDDDLFAKTMTEEEVMLEKNDLLVVYTDGVTEAMNGKRELYGEKRFLECVRKNGKLAPAEFIEALDNEMKEFCQGYPQSDDITVVAVKEKKTSKSILKSLSRKISRLKSKRMSVRDIGRELGVNMDLYNKLRKKKIAKEEMAFLTFEQKKDLMALVVNSPELGITQYVEELQKVHGKTVNELLVKNELKRVNLMTSDNRKKYAKERK